MLGGTVWGGVGRGLGGARGRSGSPHPTPSTGRGHPWVSAPTLRAQVPRLPQVRLRPWGGTDTRRGGAPGALPTPGAPGPKPLGLGGGRVQPRLGVTVTPPPLSPMWVGGSTPSSGGSPTPASASPLGAVPRLGGHHPHQPPLISRVVPPTPGWAQPAPHGPPTAAKAERQKERRDRSKAGGTGGTGTNTGVGTGSAKTVTGMGTGGTDLGTGGGR